jgi:hypothetical protein
VLTKFAENPEPTRSDFHGWSASPVYDFLATICGITSLEPGFNSVKIEPHLGALQHVKASMPYKNAGQEIKVELQRKGKNGIHAMITLPENCNGKFLWMDKIMLLHMGGQTIDM